MSTQTPHRDGHDAVISYDNQVMTEQAGAPLRHAIAALFSRRAWAELGHCAVSLPVALSALVLALPMLHNGIFWAASAGIMRAYGSAARSLAHRFLGEEIADPPPYKPTYRLRIATAELADAAALGGMVVRAGGGARVWETKTGVTTKKLPPERVNELATGAGIVITTPRPPGRFGEWLDARVLDPVAWKARAYFALKLPLATAEYAVIATCWLGGLFCVTFPVWWAIALRGTFGGSVAESFYALPGGVVLLLFAPWATHGLTEADLWLMRGLLGPGTHTERIRTLEETRARAVDDSAARLRGIERDLHDGTQAQLVALAMKLGLAMEQLQDADTGAGAGLARVAQLVGDAHRGTIEAIADLRTLTRGIHPPVLDNGLNDALATLAHRSALPVELVTDIPERPSAAIEAIAYFSAAELLSNVAKHSGARRATLEAVHVPGLLRIRVTDDGRGGARAVPGGGLRGLAERVRTVDGRIAVDSPVGGPTTVTVELPSHA
jgi:signal transduction histidine kinase